MSALLGSALALGLSAAALLGLAAYGRARWAAATQTLLDQLQAAQLPASPSHYEEAELEGLPAPVQGYLRAVLKDGQAIVAAVRVEHRGTFTVNAFGRHALWMPFSSQQQVVTKRPGFVWNARMRLLPGLEILVHDAYAAGIGTLHPALLGLLSLTQQSGGGEIARGELMRYMMEAAWYPTALLPSQGTQWRAIDAKSAEATMADREIRMTMRFHFGADGLIDTVQAESRGALVDGQLLMLPWQGRLSNYQERAGMRVPLSGEAAWLHAGERKPYWRGTITAAAYAWAG
jgi:hypothetical protein